ncbi:phosphoenolpyruvate carboxylase3 [Zea mays]|uniref:phosphoenolpyruvate carboxylase n=1 Tax=Zea mays TaxID=4577 RepID=A0A1D6I1V6_MAIZE|nr:phosphoenolpyruvate carboxylase3 [Zea mays]
MAALGAKMERLSSIDAQLRMLVPGKVSEDDKLIEYDALLLDRFLDILQDLHGDDLKEMVQECYEVAAEYETKHDLQKLDELGKMITSLDPGDSIVIAKSFSHMLNLANLAEEVQIAYRRRIKLKKGDFADENSAITESDIEETLKRLVVDLKKSPAEVFDALKSQTVDLVLTAHPTQSVRRSLLQKHSRIRNCLVQLYSKDITPDDKQELDEALQREIQAAFRTDEIRRTQPTPQDEMRAGMSYFHETIWKGVPKFLRRVDTALKNIGINERVPYNAPLIQFSSWMGGDRDGNPRVTPEVTRDVCLLARMMASNLYCSQIEDLMFELSMWRCSDELRMRADVLHLSTKKDAKHYIEFWKKVPPNEPYRVILSDVRDKLYNTRERSRELLSSGHSDIPEEATLTNVEQLLEPLELCYRSLCACGDSVIADGTLLDFLRQVSTFGLSLVRLDIRQESDRHTDVLDAITTYLPPDTIHGSLRVTVQGEVIEQSFGEEHLCFRTLQRFTAATLEHGMHPPNAPKPEWRALLDEMAVVATEEYRSIVFKEPRFVEYFRLATPETEYGRMNIGSRPSKRKPSGGIDSLRAIPWIFAWTQTRFHLPVWLGFGAAFKNVLQKDIRNLHMLQEMYNEWPFFRVTIDLVEMVFAKGNPGIAALYDKLLVSEELHPLGEKLRANYEETQKLLLQVAGHRDLLEGDLYLKQRLRLRDAYITTLNVCQAYTLKRIRDPDYHVALRPHLSKEIMDSTKAAAELVKLNPGSEYAPGLEDTLILTMKGIAAGLQNTG